jgi:PrtD family type I secretion system ABC transporter
MSKFVRIALQTAILGFGAYLVIVNEITGGLMIASSIMMGKALAPIEMAVAGWKQLLAARTSYARLNAMLAAVPADRPHMTLPAPVGALELERVIAAPPGSNIPVIKGIAFRVAPGDILGIIGPSAAGKSSLARLIVGVWPVHSGVVRIDGSDIQTWDKDRLGPHIGYLPQDIELFEGSIAENIARFSELDAEAVIDAARMAGVHEMILQLPQGYDTAIGPGGMTLSGGQRQRVGLARALYRNPALIVLDEPNSNLDRDGEAALARTLAELKARKRTTLVITHRPNILASVDYIMVMNSGLVENFGPRDEVLGKYMRPQTGTNLPSATPLTVV